MIFLKQAKKHNKNILNVYGRFYLVLITATIKESGVSLYKYSRLNRTELKGA